MYYTEFGGVKNDTFTRNAFIAHDINFTKKAAAYIADRDCTDVYRTTFCYDNTNVKESSLYGDLYFDLDKDIKNEDDFKAIKSDALIVHSYLSMRMKVPAEQIRVYFSGSKGFHIVVPAEVIGIEQKDSLNEEYKLIALEVQKTTYNDTIDMKIYDRRRLFRIVNTINSKTGLYKVPIDYKMLYTGKWEDIKAYAEVQHPEIYPEPKFNKDAADRYKKILSDSIEKNEKKGIERKNKTVKIIIPDTERPLLPCVRNALINGVSEGQRNNTAVAVASGLFQAGKIVDEVEEIMQEWNEQRVEPPLPEKEVEAVVRSAYEQAQNGQGYGCNTFFSFGYCDGAGCSLYK